MDVPASKRTKRTKDSRLENIQSLENLTLPQLTLDSPFRAIQTIDNRFDKLSEKLTTTITDSIKKEIRECEKKIIAEVNSKISEIEAKLLREIDSLKSQFTVINDRVSAVEAQCSEIDELRKEIDYLKTEIYGIQNKMSRQENSMISTELRVTGIPGIRNENLGLHYDNLCAALQIQAPKYTSIFRVGGTKYKTKSPDSTIIIKMESAYDKNYLLKSISNYKNMIRGHLKLNMIGFESNSNFFVNENLTSTNYNIFKNALKYRKMNKIVSVFTRRGIVYIKIATGDEAQPIRSVNEFNEVFRS